jgi:hypothetical protein
VWNPGLENLVQIPAPWVNCVVLKNNCVTSLGLRFPVCKVGIIIYVIMITQVSTQGTETNPTVNMVHRRDCK